MTHGGRSEDVRGGVGMVDVIVTSVEPAEFLLAMLAAARGVSIEVVRAEFEEEHDAESEFHTVRG